MNEKLIHLFLKRGVLISPNIVKDLDIEKSDNFFKILDSEILSKEKSPYLLSSEKFNEILKKSIISDNEMHSEPLKNKGNIIILKEYQENTDKKTVKDFTAHYKNRYEKLKGLLQGKRNLQNVISINRALNKKQREEVSVIGLISDKHITKNKNILLKLEDPTGSISVLINQNKEDLFEEAYNLTLDEVIGITGSMGNKIVFSNELILPGYPIHNEIKKSNEEVYMAVLSDIHVGSTMFLEEEFKKFINWTKGNEGNEEQKKIVKKLKYIFIVGDLVDGIGIYPGQEDELNILDIKDQYSKFTELIKEIRPDINIIICPGNHDAVRIAEPQPKISKELTKSLWDLPNVTMLTNPATVNIHSNEKEEGFDILLYHGYSLDYYINNIDKVRNGGGYDKPEVAMKYLLSKRHLAPSHGSSLFIPGKEDHLVIEKIPDFFLMGHVHKSGIDQAGKTTLICGSCWQSITPFQEKVGHKPETSKVQLVNLQTRKIKVMNFGK
ncbi:DNA-directed DNA polymerase II small subunit [archaeon]|jgi:DNA polymerase II small subunit|nr:DNA-directed DNA polymerase II small subunit [archaeon]